MPNYVDVDVITKYVFLADRKKTKPAKFHLRIPTLTEEERLTDLALESQLPDAEDGTARLAVKNNMIRAGLGSYWIGVEDWKPRGNTAIEFESRNGDGTPGASDRMIQKLKQVDRIELTIACLTLGRDVSEQDRDS